MPTRTVKFDAISWTTPREGQPGQFDYHRAVKGEKVELPESEAQRLDELGATIGADEDVTVVDPLAHLSPAEEVGKAAGVLTVDGEPGGPNASNREAMIAAARRQVEASIAGGDLDLPGDEVSARVAAGAVDPERAGSDVGGGSGVDDAQLRAMSATDVVAHLNQHPEDVERVATLEAERDKPRATVERAVEAHRAAADDPDAIEEQTGAGATPADTEG